MLHVARFSHRRQRRRGLGTLGRAESCGPGRAWLTGYERSTLGDALRARSLPLVAEPRPAQHFFERSDSIAYACLGIPAHTLS